MFLGAVLVAAHAAPRVHTVVIDGMRFVPQRVDVTAGDTVVWRNRDPFPHTATGEQGGPDSPVMAAGGSWSYKATRRGRFPYVCTLHRTMTGVLVVR